MNASEKLFLADIQARPDQRMMAVAFVVESEDFESIHNRSAYALIRRDGRV